MTVDAIRDLSHPNVRGPIAVDDSGRSGQTFAVLAQTTRDDETRSALATGHDIYATTAPILVECMGRVLRTNAVDGGIYAAGVLFDARSFLDHLAPHEMWVTVEAA